MDDKHNLATRGQLDSAELRCEYLENPLGIDAKKPRLSWIVTGNRPADRVTAYRIQVATSVALLEVGNPDLWDSGKVDSSETVNIPYQGLALASRTRYHWNVRVWDGQGHEGGVSAAAWFETALLNPEDFTAAWVFGTGATARIRHEFELDAAIASARLYLCGQGVYEVYLNGCQADDTLLNPTLSFFAERMYYDTYDITRLLSVGQNAIGVWLAPGWYGDPSTWTEMRMPRKLRGYPQPLTMLYAQIEIIDINGRRQTINSNSAWKTKEAPLKPVQAYWEYCFGFSGETWDASAEEPDWHRFGFDDSTWYSRRGGWCPTKQLSARIQEPNRAIGRTPADMKLRIGQDASEDDLIRVINEYNIKNGGTTFHPSISHFYAELQMRYQQSIRLSGQPFLGGYLFDLGRHVSGKVELVVTGERGCHITMFGLDNYIMHGGGPEMMSLHFIHRVVRYVPVFFFGAKSEPTIISVTGVDINNDLKSAGRFTCSDEKLNEIARVVSRTSIAHMLSGMMMDSWQERFGTFIPGEECVYVRQTAAFLRKLAADMQDQHQAGRPSPMTGIPLSLDYPFLKMHLVGLPMLLYLYYGDKDTLSDCFNLIEEYSDKILPRHDLSQRTWQSPLESTAEPGYGDHGRPTARWYEPHEGDLFETLQLLDYYRMASFLAEKAGRTDKQEEYGQVCARLEHKANRADFLDRDQGIYVHGDQGCQALAQYLEIVPPEISDQNAEQLIHDIMVSRDGHLNTGFAGTVYLLKALAKLDRADVGNRLLTNETAPSISSMLDHPLHGERLSILPEFYTGGMIPHPGLSTVGFWFYKVLAGINPDPAGPAFRKIIIKPASDRKVAVVRAEYDSIRGRIVSEICRKDDHMTLDVVIPQNSTAEVWLKGCPVLTAGSCTKRIRSGPYTVFTIHGGHYQFATQNV